MRFSAVIMGCDTLKTTFYYTTGAMLDTQLIIFTQKRGISLHSPKYLAKTSQNKIYVT